MWVYFPLNLFIISSSYLIPSFISTYEANSGTFYSANEYAGLFGIISISDSFLPASSTSHPSLGSNIKSGHVRQWLCGRGQIVALSEPVSSLVVISRIMVSQRGPHPNP